MNYTRSQQTTARGSGKSVYAGRTAGAVSAIWLGLALATSTKAIDYETPGGVRFGLNGYADVEYTYMSPMPMFMQGTGMPGMGGMFTEMDSTSTVSQHHLNLIGGVEYKQLRGNVNFESLNSLTSGDEGLGRSFARTLRRVHPQ